jgi:multicomponent Na+:H+ antiporter subunit D
LTASSAQSGSFLLVLAIVTPLAGSLLVVGVGGRHAERIGLSLLFLGLVIAAALAAIVWHTGTPLDYWIGGWAPPLGIALRADGLSCALLLLTAVILTASGLFALGQFASTGVASSRACVSFWTLALALCGALNIVFLSNDLFNLYVALELLTFSAVPLVSLSGQKETLAAGLRYLLFALFGSVLYLLGVVLIYSAYATLDLSLLAASVRPGPLLSIALALMTAGLLAKTALFPLHLWLPPAHAGAPAAASAVLSGLVVKASFFLLMRLWFDLIPGAPGHLAALLLAALGSAAILFGSVLALRQRRLKLMIAYSTVAQIGYLFLMIPLLDSALAGGPWDGFAWTGGWLQLIAHALAKASMFLAAGLIAEAVGHDRIDELDGVGRALPITCIAFGIGGLSLIGLPPTGGFVAKWLLMTAAVREGQWIWAFVMVAGGLLAASYVFPLIARALAERPLSLAPVSRRRQTLVLALAIGTLVLGLAPLQPIDALEIGRFEKPRVSAP